MNKNKIIVNNFINVIKTIEMRNNHSSTKKFDDEFLKMLIDEVNILNIDEMISDYKFSDSPARENGYFDDFFAKFYSFEKNEEHILFQQHNMYYEIKIFHENQIRKYFNDEYGLYELNLTNCSFMSIFLTLLKEIKFKNEGNKFNDCFEKMNQKWWVYYTQETGEYNKLRKIIIQRIIKNYIISENGLRGQTNDYKLFLKYLNKYSIEDSKISKLLFLALNDDKNCLHWFNLFANLDIKDFKKNNIIFSFVQETALERIDKLLNLNSSIKLLSHEVYSILSNPKINYLFFKNRIINKNIQNDLQEYSNTNFFIYVFYLLKYNNQEKNILKFVKDFFDELTRKIDLEKFTKVDEIELKIIEDLIEPIDENKPTIFSAWKIFKDLFSSLKISESAYEEIIKCKTTKENAINYINNHFDNDVNDFCKRNSNIKCTTSNLKDFFIENQDEKENKNGYILEFINIFLILKDKKEISIKEIDGLLSYFIARFEYIYAEKYQIIFTNYSALNKKEILANINMFLDKKHQLNDVNKVSDDVWRTFIEYDLLSLKDINNWSKYEQKGDKLYAIIINKLIIKGNLRESRDKSIYESAIFQDKIFKKINLTKYLIKSELLWKKNFKSADYLEYLLFALFKNYGYETAELFLINLLKVAGEFRDVAKRDLVSIVRVPRICVESSKEDYYTRPYYVAYDFHLRLIESIKDFYCVDYFESMNYDFPNWHQIKEENEQEIFAFLTEFLTKDFKSFDLYLQNKFRKDK